MRTSGVVSARLTRHSLVRAARNRTRAVVLEEEALLRPGLYVRYGEAVWRHWRVELPDHLRLSKIRQEGSSADARGRVRNVLSSALQRSLPPITFRTSRRGTGTYPIAVAAHDGGVVLLDPQGGKVARKYASRPVDAEYVALRSRFSRHVPAPSFEVSAAGRYLTEDYVRGAHFAGLDDADQLGAVRKIFDYYASLTEHEGEGNSQAVVGAAVRAASGSRPVHVTAELLSAFDLPTRSATWPLVPSATDASVKNLIVTPEGLPVPIDLGNIRLDPCFYYPVGLVIMARGSVLDRFVTGDLDEELGALLGAAATDFPFHGRGREALLALRLALTSHREAMASGSFQQAVFDHSLARRWALLRSGRPAAYS